MTTRWTDNAGREWTARVTIGLAEHLRSGGIDLLDPKSLASIVDDPLRVVGLLCDLHAQQWQELGITRGDFAEVVTETAEVATAAVEAMTEGLADFFARIRRPALAAVVREAMAHAVAAEKQATELVSTRGKAKLQRMLTAALREAETNLDSDDASDATE